MSTLRFIVSAEFFKEKMGLGNDVDTVSNLGDLEELGGAAVGDADATVGGGVARAVSVVEPEVVAAEALEEGHFSALVDGGFPVAVFVADHEFASGSAVPFFASGDVSFKDDFIGFVENGEPLFGEVNADTALIAVRITAKHEFDHGGIRATDGKTVGAEAVAAGIGPSVRFSFEKGINKFHAR